MGTEGQGVFRTDDSGVTWIPKNNNLGDGDGYIYKLAVDGQTIWVSINGDVFFSDDNGNSWVSANNGLTDVEVNSFAFSGNKVFAGTSGGVYLSTDKGSTWTEVNDGFPESLFQWAIVALKENTLIASYGYQGVFINSTLLTSTDIAYRDLPEVRIFPNPAEHTIILETNDMVAEGILSLYNVGGQQVLKRLITTHLTDIDISSLPAGLYIVRYDNGVTLRTGRFIKE